MALFGKKNDIQKDMFVYVIHDAKAAAYRDPILYPSDEVLCRTIINEFTDPRYARTDLFNNAEDFTIFCIGYFERKSGTLVSTEPLHVANVFELRQAAYQKLVNEKKQFPAIDDMRRSMEIQKAMEKAAMEKETPKGEGH